MGRQILARWVWVVLALAAGCVGAFTRTSKASLGERLEVMLGGGGNSGIFLHGSDALVVDTKFGDYSRRLDNRVEEELRHTVRRLVLTHFHADHASHADLFPGVGAVLVHPNALARLKSQPPQGTPPTLPYVEVADEVQLLLGGEPVLVLYPGRAHTDGDLVVHFPERRVLFTGDIVLTGYEPRIDATGGGDPLAFRHTLERMLTLDFDTVVPGHGPVGSRADVVRYRDYFAALEAAVRERVRRGESEEAVAREVELPEFDDLRPMPLGISSREKTVRLMYKALARP